jgi:murein DD-endopeptidase MepM/ murein hydrolase activator NlpD
VSFNGVIFPIARPRITMPFKATETKWYSNEKPHRGVDVAPFPGSAGQPVRMPLVGTIVRVGEHEFAGKEIVSRHQAPYPFGAHGLDGAVYTVAAGEVFHLRSTHHQHISVREGDQVPAGAVIAHIGSTGRYTTGPHVHLELHKGGYPGIVLDPIDFFIAAIPGLRDVIVRPW